MAPEPTPAQQQLREQLFDQPPNLAEVDRELRHRLRARIERGLVETAQVLGDQSLFVRKSLLTDVLRCHGLVAARDAEPFQWRAPIARGQLTHRALELGQAAREPVPAIELVDRAIDERVANVASDPHESLGVWLSSIDALELSEVRSMCTALVRSALDTLPVVGASDDPAWEVRRHVDLLGGSVRWRGAFDLTIGRAVGRVPGVVIIDFKTGSAQPDHRDDLRYYAVLETLRTGVPPRRLVSFYVGSGTIIDEVVDTDVLEAGARRATEGTRQLAMAQQQARAGEQPVLTPGPHCRWCPVSDTCPASTELNGEDDVDAQLDAIRVRAALRAQ